MDSETNKLESRDLSEHLFWDVDVDSLNADRSERLFISRVLQYGTIEDWRRIRAYYGIAEIARVAMTIRDLEPRSATFVALLANIPKEEFACFTKKPSTPKHWVS